MSINEIPEPPVFHRYEPGIGIAFHVDAHSAFDEGIAAITLGSGIATCSEKNVFWGAGGSGMWKGEWFVEIDL